MAPGAAVSGAESALESAVLAVLRADAAVKALLGDPVRVAEVDSGRPSLPDCQLTLPVADTVFDLGYQARVIHLEPAFHEGGRPAVELKFPGSHPDIDLYGFSPASLDVPSFCPGFPMLIAGHEG